MSRNRAREYGIEIGDLPVGRENAITDVAGVRVGHVTLNEGEGALEIGKGASANGRHRDPSTEGRLVESSRRILPVYVERIRNDCGPIVYRRVRTHREPPSV